ncbi:DUF3710 domain-containing protein [Corynebacterium bouchesdurhonense]|uniref:DUF3710 domain-containing protein n=1 Tax=Corynebacterium bouchesdurhonense TaxID=1720192 RepID=UPI00082B3ACC|nr:DUF3710 domain-containing protein [Corynebacterium bouchesdurhonense]
MALWPFGRNKKKAEPEAPVAPAAPVEPVEDAQPVEAAPAEVPVYTEEQPQDVAAAPGTEPIANYDPVGGTTGPFDGDSVEIEDFDFTDFSDATLNLGSMRIPMPKGTQVQVEMGDEGPKMVHIVTPSGRFTPVAFAAPRTGGLWEESAAEIAEGMRSEGMPVRFEQGPWGKEIVGTGTNGVIRIIGVEGPRWLFRVTLAAPTGREDAMAQLGRETIARSFVYRGEDPVLAGNSLPVTLPEQLALQVQQAVAARAAQQQGQQVQGSAPAPGNPNALSDALRQIMEMNNPGSAGTK